MLLKRVYPQITRFRLKKLAKAFGHWKSFNTRSKIFELDCRIIEKITKRKILKHYELNLLKYFRKWLTVKNGIKIKIQNALDKIAKFSKKKVFTMFSPLIKKQGTIKLMGNSILRKIKIEIENIQNIFDFWNSQAINMKMKSSRYLVATKFVLGIQRRKQKQNEKLLLSFSMRKWNIVQKSIRNNFIKNTDKIWKLVNGTTKKIYLKHILRILGINSKNSKFLELLNSIDNRNENKNLLILKNKLQFWHKQVNDEVISEFRMNILYGKLKFNIEKIHLKRLNYNFQKFKKQKYNPEIINQLKGISNIYSKKIFKDLNKNTMFINQNLPKNQNKMGILLNGGRNKAKLNIFPVIFKSRFFRKWKEIKNLMSKKKFSTKIIEKRIFELINRTKLNLSQKLQMWNLQTKNIQAKEKQESIISRIIKNFSSYIDQKRLKKFLLLWKLKSEKSNSNEINIQAGIQSLKKFNLFQVFKNFRKNNIHVIEKKKDLRNSKLLIFSYLVSNKKQILFLNLMKWRKQIDLQKNQELKNLILKNLIINQNTSKIKFLKRRLVENVLMWRYKAFPHILYKYNLFRIRGELKTNDTLRSHLNQYILDKIKFKSNYLKFRQKIKKVTNQITKNLENIILKNRLIQWKDRLNDKNRVKQKLKIWFNNYFDLLNSQKANITGPLAELKNTAKNIIKRKGEMAARILDNLKSKLAKKKVTKLRSKRDKTKNTFTKTSELLKRKMCSYIAFWKIQSIKLKLFRGAQIIQRKFREYRNRKNLKGKKTEKISNSFNKVFIKKSFNKIKNSSNHNRLSELMQKIIKDIPYEERFKFYSKYLKLWSLRAKELEKKRMKKK